MLTYDEDGPGMSASRNSGSARSRTAIAAGVKSNTGVPTAATARASGGGIAIATLLPPECTGTAADFRRALRRNRRQLIRLSIADSDDVDGKCVDRASGSSTAYNVDATGHHEHEHVGLEDTDTLLHPVPCPLDLPLPAVARIVHYFSTSSSWLSTSWTRPNLDVVSSVLAENAILSGQRANADAGADRAGADRADALLRAMDFPGFAIRSMDAASDTSGILGWERGCNEKCAVGDDPRVFLLLFAAATGRNKIEAGIGGGAGVGDEDGSADGPALPLNSLVERAWIHSPEGQLDLLLCLLQMDRRNNGGYAGGLFWHLLSEEEREDVDEIIIGTSTSTAGYDDLPDPIGMGSTKVLYRILQFPDHPSKPILGEKVMKFLFGTREGEPGVVAQCPEALICSFTRLDMQFMSGTITLGPRARRFMMGAVEQLRCAYFWPLPSCARIARTRSAVYRRLWEAAPDEIEISCLKLWHAVTGTDGSIPDDRTVLHITISHIANIICHSAETPASIPKIIDGKKDNEYQLIIGMFLADSKQLNLSEWLFSCAKIRRSGRLFVEAILYFVEKEFVMSLPRKDAWKNGVTILSLENLATLLRFLSKTEISATVLHAKKRIKRLMKKCFDLKGGDSHFIRDFKRPILPTIEEEDGHEGEALEDNGVLELEGPFGFPRTHSPYETDEDSFQLLNVAMSSISLEKAPPATYGSPTKKRATESSAVCNPGDHVPTDVTSKTTMKNKWSSPTSVKDIANISTRSWVPADNSFDAHKFLTTTKKNIPVSANTVSINMNALQSPPKKAGNSLNVLSKPTRLVGFEAKLKATLDGILANIDTAADRLIAAAGPSASRLLCLAEIPRDHDIKHQLMDAALCVETALNASDPKNLEAIERGIILFTKAVFDKLYETPTRPEPFRLEAHVGLLELILARLPTLKPSLVAWGDKRSHAETKEQRDCYAHVASLLLRSGLMGEESATM